MKKLLALLLASLMMLTLISCGTPSDGGDGTDGGKTPNGDDPIFDSDDLAAIDSALDILEILKPDGWDENSYGMYIYDVWDEEFLPDVLPGPVDGIKVYETTFKDHKHDVLNSDYSVGPIWYESYEDYRKYGVSFYATEAQLDSFIDKVTANGFTGCEKTTRGEDDWWEFYFYNEEGWFLYIFVNTNANDEGYDGLVSVSLTDSLFENPKSVDGNPLPKKGAPAYDYTKGHSIYNESYDELDFDVSSDSFPTDAFYATFFDYFGTDAKYAKSYTSELVSAGWGIEQEDDKADSENSYYALLSKDGHYAQVRFADYDGNLQVGFASMVEALQY